MKSIRTTQSNKVINAVHRIVTFIGIEQLNWESVAGVTWRQVDNVALVTVSHHSQYLHT